MKRLLAIVSVAVIAGCATIERAREAQTAVSPRADGQVSPVAKVDFRGSSLSALVGFAMTNRPSVASARLAVEDARLALKEIQADAPLLSDTPWSAATLGLRGDYSESSRGTTWGERDWRTAGGPTAGLSLEVLVCDFGRNAARGAAAAENVIAAEQALIEAGDAVFLEVAKGYFDYREARSLFEVALTNEAQYADHLARAEAQLRAGEAYRLDVLRARLDLAQARQRSVAASNTVATVGAELMRALGVEAARGTAEEAFGNAPIGIDTVYRGFPRTYGALEESFAFARTNAPAVAIARARLRSASHSVDAAVADLYPQITASANLSWTDPLWLWNWGVGAFESLFEGFGRTTRIDRARVAMESAAAAVDEAEQQLSVRLETAIANRDDSLAAIASAMASVRSAKENLDTVQEQLSVGSVSRVELSEAIAFDSNARGDLISAFYSAQRAEAALYAVMGLYPVYQEEVVKGDFK